MDNLPWATLFNRCRAVREKDEGCDYWGRCELRRHNHSIDHALERGMVIPRWSTEWTVWTQPAPKESKWVLDQCNCTVHDITTPGAAHAIDCPFYD